MPPARKTVLNPPFQPDVFGSIVLPSCPDSNSSVGGEQREAPTRRRISCSPAVHEPHEGSGVTGAQWLQGAKEQSPWREPKKTLSRPVFVATLREMSCCYVSEREGGRDMFAPGRSALGHSVYDGGEETLHEELGGRVGGISEKPGWRAKLRGPAPHRQAVWEQDEEATASPELETVLPVRKGSRPPGVWCEQMFQGTLWAQGRPRSFGVGVGGTQGTGKVRNHMVSTYSQLRRS